MKSAESDSLIESIGRKSGHPPWVNTLETGYKKVGSKNKSLIRLLFPRAKACNLSTILIAYKNKSHTPGFGYEVHGFVLVKLTI